MSTEKPQQQQQKNYEYLVVWPNKTGMESVFHMTPINPIHPTLDHYPLFAT